MYLKKRLYALLRYFCVKISHKQNFIILSISTRPLSRLLKKYSSLWDDGWYAQQSRYLLFLKRSSAKMLLTSFGKTCFCKISFDIVSRMKIIIPTPFLFLFNLYDLERISIKNRDSKKVSSSFVSVTTRISVYFSTVSFNCLNLFLTELIFRLTIITLFTFPIRTFYFCTSYF